MSSLNAVSLFSGCGGFDLGLSRHGVDIVWANDIDNDAAEAYQSIFPNVQFVKEDIRKIETFPSADVLIGCYPCTGFSQAAKRKWKDRDERNLRTNPSNFLFLEFLRAIKIVQPKVVFVENVKGMLSADAGTFFHEQLQGLSELGFDVVHHKLLNGIDYGLPQSRQRLFLVGIHNSISKNVSYQFPEATHGTGRLPYQTLLDVIGGMPLDPKGEYSEQVFHGHYLTRNRKRQWDEPSFTIVANADHVPLHPFGEPMKKIGVDNWVLQGEFNRRLSYKECLAIQGLPMNMKLSGNLNSRYKVAGNAVPPLLAEIVSRPIIHQLKELLG
jgi:DNA (cytosine-5)-methyltransferase 1